MNEVDTKACIQRPGRCRGDPDHGAMMMPPPPPVTTARVGAASHSRTDRVHEMERLSNHKIHAPPQKRRGRGPTRDCIPSSRQFKMATTDQTGGHDLKVVDTVELMKSSQAEDLAVYSNLPLSCVDDSRGRQNKAIEMMQRATGLMTRVPIFLNNNSLAEYPDTWPHDCWWCAHKFTSRPVGYPTKYNSIHDSYSVTGYYCSYNCARAGMNDRVPSHRSGIVSMWMRSMLKQHFKGQGLKLATMQSFAEPSPHWSCLKNFGGHMTIEEFRTQHTKQTRLECYPQSMHLVPVGFNIFELQRDTSKTFAKVRPAKYRKTIAQVETEGKRRRVPAAKKTVLPSTKSRATKTRKRKAPSHKKETSSKKKACIPKESTEPVADGEWEPKSKSINRILWEQKREKQTAHLKMKRKTPRPQVSIRSMMGIK